MKYPQILFLLFLNCSTEAFEESQVDLPSKDSPSIAEIEKPHQKKYERLLSTSDGWFLDKELNIFCKPNQEKKKCLPGIRKFYSHEWSFCFFHRKLDITKCPSLSGEHTNKGRPEYGYVSFEVYEYKTGAADEKLDREEFFIYKCKETPPEKLLYGYVNRWCETDMNNLVSIEIFADL